MQVHVHTLLLGPEECAGDSVTCGEHRHTCAWAHRSGPVPSNSMATCSNRQHAFIQSCP